MLSSEQTSIEMTTYGANKLLIIPFTSLAQQGNGFTKFMQHREWLTAGHEEDPNITTARKR